ncbi:MAG TPA: hybrid sensor histidine kinase/response regulator [Verrucomicrobiales bacterium]|jgi:two-component system sensor histidine kinase/response regulator|nr:hybrid sensor histidine kinase/response regulator [Verrucomicrobiales bacterium]
MSEATHPFHAGSILVVDDQTTNIQTVGTLLHSMGYDVMTATSAAQAVQRMGIRKPDLILLDMMMPGEDGLELCRRLQGKPQWAEIPVIFLSAAGEVNLITSALEAGAVDYVTKPFHRAELLSRVRTHLALKASRDQLRRVAEDKEQLLGLIAHDFKNHLAAMQLHSAYLNRHTANLPQDAVRCVETISREAGRMAECVKELLANEAASQQKLVFEDVDLAALANSLAASCLPLAEAKQQTLSVSVPAQPVTVFTDAGAVRRVIGNLLSNAVKFTPRGGTVTFAVTEKNGGIDIVVSDSGPGFSEEDKVHAFTRYGRLSARPTGGEISTGLGLNIVKKLTELMGGRVSLESTSKGAVCSVHLPGGVREDRH